MASDKETTPSPQTVSGDGGAATPSNPTPAVTFTEREERILKVAWFCLKSGAPDVDVQKLTRLGEFKTTKTASNTWGVIKKKLNAMAPEDLEGEGGAAGDSTPTKTPSKKTPSKRPKPAATAEDGDEVDASPAKKAKKSPVKKGSKQTIVKKGTDGEDDSKVKDEKLEEEEEMVFT